MRPIFLTRRAWLVAARGGLVSALTAGRTKYVTLSAIPALTAVAVLTGPWSSSDVSKIVGALALVGVPLCAAAACWWCALEMAAVKMKIEWILLGAAAALFGIGQYLEEFGGQDVGGMTVAKVLFLVAIVAFGTGVAVALRSFVGFLDLHRPVQISVSLAAAVTVVAGLGLGGMVTRMSGSHVDKIVLALYPLGVLWCMVVPALALALTVSQMGSGAVARPWWAVLFGVTLVACANMVLLLAAATGVPITNAGPAEFGWWIGMSVIAVGAAMQVDIQKPAHAASRSAGA